MASIGAENERSTEIQPGSRVSGEEDRSVPVFANGNGTGNGPTANNYMPVKSISDGPTEQARSSGPGVQIFGIAGQSARYLSTGAGYPPRMMQQYPGYAPAVPGLPYHYQQPSQQQQQAAVKPGGQPQRHHPYPGAPAARPQSAPGHGYPAGPWDQHRPPAGYPPAARPQSPQVPGGQQQPPHRPHPSQPPPRSPQPPPSPQQHPQPRSPYQPPRSPHQLPAQPPQSPHQLQPPQSPRHQPQSQPPPPQSPHQQLQPPQSPRHQPQSQPPPAQSPHQPPQSPHQQLHQQQLPPPRSPQQQLQPPQSPHQQLQQHQPPQSPHQQLQQQLQHPPRSPHQQPPQSPHQQLQQQLQPPQSPHQQLQQQLQPPQSPLQDPKQRPPPSPQQQQQRPPPSPQQLLQQHQQQGSRPSSRPASTDNPELGASEQAAALPEPEPVSLGGRSSAAPAARTGSMAPAAGQPVSGGPPRPPGRPDPSQRLAPPPMPYVPPAAGKPGYMPHPGYRPPGQDPNYRPPGQEQYPRPPGHDPAVYRPPQDPAFRPPGPGQDPTFRPPGPGQDPAYRPTGPGQDPAFRPPGPGQDPAFRSPGPGQDPAFRLAGSESQGPPPPPPGAVPYGGHTGMYGSPYGRPAPAPPPGAQHYPGYPGQQPWPASAAPPSSGVKPGPATPVSPHLLRHQLSQKLQLGVPPRPASQGSEAGPGEPPPLLGPDGTPLDDGSQHSTLSNASGNSEEASRSPRRDLPGSQPPPPPSGLTFPGPGGQGVTPPGHEEDTPGPAAAAPGPGGVTASPGGPLAHTAAAWIRSPGAKAESLARLFEMDDTPGRREWVGRLLSFMEERGTPILQCPTVSKQPLDLFKLYHFTKERGGFVEVTTNKTWKDVATVMGIGGSSSGAYTLRKHYMKHLLAFECRFDRGGADPAPIIAKFETKSSKKAKRPSSPGPQDSFSNSGSLDGFPGGYPPGYPRPEFNGTGPGVPPQGGYPAHGYPGQQTPQPGYGQYMSGPGGPPRPPGPPGQEYPPQHPQQPPHPQQHPQQHSQQQQQYMQQYPNRSYPGSTGPAPPSGPEYRYPGPPPGPSTYGGPARPALYPPARTPPPQTASPAATPPPPGYGPPPGDSYPPATGSPAAPSAAQQGAYTPTRPPGPVVSSGPQSQLAKQLSAPPSQPPRPMLSAASKPSGAASSPTLCRQLAAPPAALVSPAAQQLGVARHGVPYSGSPTAAGVPPRPYGGSGPPGAVPPGGAGVRPGPPPTAGGPYSQHQTQHPQQHPQQQPQQHPQMAQQHPQQQQQHPGQQQQQQPYGGWRGGQYGQWPPRYPAPGQWSGASQTQPGGRTAVRPDRPVGPAKPMPAAYMRPTFPPDSVEATLPVLARRRRGTRADLGPVDGWRLTMALRSGQLAESRWALDALQILTFDDTSISWLGLSRMPGLLAALLQHFRLSLAVMFSRRAAGGWFEEGGEDEPEPDLGVCRQRDTPDRERLLKGTDYSRVSRHGRVVELDDCSEKILVSPRRRAWEADSADVDGDWRHVMTHVKVESGWVPFQRRLVDGRIKTEPKDEPGEDSCTAIRVKSEGDVSEEDSPKENDQPPLDERLAGFDDPGFFLSRMRRATPAVPDANSSIASDGAVKDVADVRGDTTGVGDKTKGDECDKGVKEEAMEVDVKKEPEETPVKMEMDPVAKSEPGSGEEKPLNLPNGAVSPAAPPRSELLVRGSLKRPPPDEEDECQQRDESSLFLTSETQESVAARCLAASTVLRNLSFVPGNEAELACEPVLTLLGDLLQLHHRHPARAAPHTNYDRDEDADQREPCPALGGDEWWADYLPVLHEHALVTLTNIGGQVRLGGYDEPVIRPVLDGLLHWVQCRASYAADPLPAGGSALPATRLALEALCRLVVHAENVDLLLATPPGWRLERVCRLTAEWIAAEGDQVRREMALTLLHALAGVDERVARVLAAETDLAATLVRFVEAAEQSAMNVANSQGVGALQENPDLMGTSLDLLGRAAGLLLSLAPLPEARPALLRCEARLLALVTSPILDQRVAAQLSRVLYRVALPDAECA